MSGKPKEFQAEKYIAEINNLKKALLISEKDFTFNTLKVSLIKIGLPKSNTFWMVFKKHINIIHKSGKLYRFVNSEPISANQIQQIYDEYIRQQKVYYNNAMDKKIKTEESVEEFTLRAIKHLKDLGYKLMEPYTAYRPV